MKIVFFCNYLNHHQVLLADAFYKLLGSNYTFVSTMPVDESLLKGSVDYSNQRSYCLRAFESKENRDKAMGLARSAEVTVFGSDYLPYAVERAKYGHGISFEICERWLKRGWLNLASPRLRAWWLAYQRYFKNKDFYRLCASAFTTSDDIKLRVYKNRSFKWGYFTEVSEYNDDNIDITNPKDRASILWCARFIWWKHPELVVKLADRLKKNGVCFHLDMIGDGELLEKMKVMAQNLEVMDVVTFHGNKPNSDVLEAMKKHDIFLFTSDKNEGWGAVANEAMSNGCCLVGSNAIGSVPYLVKDNENGLIFQSCNLNSLYEKVLYLIKKPQERERMAKAGIKTMQKVWNPKRAAENFLSLVDSLQNNRQANIKQGPCSIT